MKQRVVVIGTGFGGLAAALRLASRGHPVEVVEALDRPGGRARVFPQDGFTFDAGPTVITAPQLFEELFAAAGRRFRDYVELVPVDPFYRIDFPDGSQFDFVGDEERLLAQIEQFEPRDVDGYRRLAEVARRIYDVGYVQLAEQPFDKLSTMLRVVPQMMRLESYRTVWDIVSRHIRDERLRQVFTFEPLLVGGSPFRASSIYLLIHWLERRWGVYYAKGGTGAIVNALTRVLAEKRVQIRYNEAVEHIDVRGGEVRGVVTAQRYIPADIVVANADPTQVYGRLIDAARRPRHSDGRLSRVRQSMSLFVAYFGASRQYDQLAHHTIVLGERYRELLRDIFERRVLADDHSLYLHAPTRTDATMAPPGHEAFYVLSPVPNNRSGIDWSNGRREDYFGRILETLEARLLPGISSALVTQRFLTPHEFEHELRSADGAAFGPEPLLTQSAYFRYHNRSRDVKGLYFVGAGTHPGGGVPGVLSSARVLERLIA
jgi:phytoene desaturase